MAKASHTHYLINGEESGGLLGFLRMSDAAFVFKGLLYPLENLLIKWSSGLTYCNLSTRQYSIGVEEGMSK